MPRRPFAPAPFTRGAWITWTGPEGRQRHGQVVTQSPGELTWWVTSLDGDRLDPVLLHRQPCRSWGARRARDEAVARGEQPYRFEVWTAETYELYGRQRVRRGALLGEARASRDPYLPALVVAPAVSTLSPLFDIAA
ncbi:hypothetical protein ACIP5N_33905 [Streptomyces sp. NPDC088768]|uniref:hypothetical protein n=1 Tax=Streptomyces sp. NPDC088768 TaxID=3365894 RepID=UPI00381B8423